MNRAIALAALLVTLFASVHPAPALALNASFNISGCSGNAQNPGKSGDLIFARIYNGGPICDAADSGAWFANGLEQKVGGVWTLIDLDTPAWEADQEGFNNVPALYVDCGGVTANKTYRTVVYGRGDNESPPILWQPVAHSSSYDHPRNCNSPA